MASAAASPRLVLGRLALRLAAQHRGLGHAHTHRRPQPVQCDAAASDRPGAAAAAATAAAAPSPPAAAAPSPLLLDHEDHGSGADDVREALSLPRKLGSAAEAGATGAFQRLPMVAPGKELLGSALRRAARVPHNRKLKNEAQKAKNRCAAGARVGAHATMTAGASRSGSAPVARV